MNELELEGYCASHTDCDCNCHDCIAYKKANSYKRYNEFDIDDEGDSNQ